MRPCPICGAASLPEAGFGDAPLRRCAGCRFVFLDDDGAGAAELYADGYFSAYDGGDYREREAEHRLESRVRLDLLARFAAPPARLLEIGAAAGFFLDEARSRGYPGAGVEPNAVMAAHARDRLGLDVRAGTLADVALEDGAYDAVCAWHVVEHLPDPVADLRRAAAALRPRGWVLVEVPNVESATARRLGAGWPALDLPYHVGHHGPRSLTALLERAGFEPVLVETLPFAVYDPLVRRFGRPAALARAVAESARARTPLPAGSHPSGHQLLRAVGCRA